jgi:transposase
MMYGGIDLHSNNSVIAIVDCADRVVAQKRLPNEISKIIGFLARWRDEMAGVQCTKLTRRIFAGFAIGWG